MLLSLEWLFLVFTFCLFIYSFIFIYSYVYLFIYLCLFIHLFIYLVQFISLSFCSVKVIWIMKTYIQYSHMRTHFHVTIPLYSRFFSLCQYEKISINHPWGSMRDGAARGECMVRLLSDEVICKVESPACVWTGHQCMIKEQHAWLREYNGWQKRPRVMYSYADACSSLFTSAGVL